MIVNPTVDRLRHPKYNKNLSFVCPADSYGIEGQGGNQVLQKINQGAQKSIKQLSSGTSNKTIIHPKILCMVYMVYTEDSAHKNLAAIADTWGRRCDGFFGASNFTDHSIGVIDLPHVGPEAYKNMWQKIRAMWAYAYKHYLVEYDYFYICGDDTYVAVDNLRAYFISSQVQRLEAGYLDRVSNHPRYHEKSTITARIQPQPLVFGAIMMHKRFPVIAGGSGYALNKAALKFYGENGIDTFLSNNIDSREDIFIGSYFAENGIFISDTNDEKDGNRFGPSAQFSYTFNGWQSPTAPKCIHELFGYNETLGIDSCSKQQISFHLKDDKKQLLSLNESYAHLMY